jgi:hypothetical protein
MTKEELLAEMHRRQAGISEGLSIPDYTRRCIEVMFEVAAEVLAELAHKKRDE